MGAKQLLKDIEQEMAKMDKQNNVFAKAECAERALHHMKYLFSHLVEKVEAVEGKLNGSTTG